MKVFPLIFLALLQFGKNDVLVRQNKITADKKSHAKPNVVFIMADDLGSHDLGCYGQEYIKTPNIDRLASEGLKFTDFYAGAAVCAPSRSVLQTGMHTGHTTVRGNECRAGGLYQPPGSTGRPGSMRIGLSPSDTTIGNVMQKAGYYTCLIGKWHLSGYRKENLPVYHGYDEYMGSCLADARSSAPGMMFFQDSVKRIPEEFKADSRDGICANLAVDFIKRNRNNPFFLMLMLSTPHKPFNISSQGIYTDKPWNEITKNYAALVTRIDQHVGQVMKALKDLGLEDNTIVVFCSDNGGEYRETPEDWAEWTRTFQSNMPFKGGKADFYEGGIRVPMIIKWPGIIEKGKISNQPLYFADIMPTLAEIAGVKTPDRTDGVSMVKLLIGEKEKLDDRFIYWEFEHRGFHQAVRWNNWVMLRWTHRQQRIYGEPGINDDRVSKEYPLYELYNLDADISEDNNVIEQYPEVAATILNFLKTASDDSPYYPLTDWEKQSLDTLNLTVFK
jgi:arylsulfatase A-like enzyme